MIPTYNYENLIRELYKKKNYKDAIYIYNSLQKQNIALST